MTVKQNTYFSPIDNLSYLDHIIFNLKLIVFVVSSITLIFALLLFRKLIPFFDKWLPVIFHKLLIWLLSIQIDLRCMIKITKNFVSNFAICLATGVISGGNLVQYRSFL